MLVHLNKHFFIDKIIYFGIIKSKTKQVPFIGHPCCYNIAVKKKQGGFKMAWFLTAVVFVALYECFVPRKW